MKVNRPVIPSLYFERKLKRKGWKKKFYLLSILLLLVLLVLRFLNISLIWHLTSLELKSNPMVEIQDYFFLGFSSYDKAKKRLIQYSDVRPRKIAIISYYTALNPANFLISNRGNQTFIDIGRLAVFIQPGFTWIRISTEDVIELHWNNIQQSIFFGFSVLSFLFDRSPFHSPEQKGDKTNRISKISYVSNDLESSKFMKIPYIIYFYLPLLLILWLSSIYGKGFLSAFLYFLGLFFLFDFKKVLVTIPFFWFSNLMNIQIPEIISLVISVGILFLFMIISIVGIFNLKKMDGVIWGKFFIFMFIFLPVFLRF